MNSYKNSYFVSTSVIIVETVVVFTDDVEEETVVPNSSVVELVDEHDLVVVLKVDAVEVSDSTISEEVSKDGNENVYD